MYSSYWKVKGLVVFLVSERRIAGMPDCWIARVPECQSARVPERQNARTPERQNAGTLERWNVRTSERQNVRTSECWIVIHTGIHELWKATPQSMGVVDAQLFDRVSFTLQCFPDASRSAHTERQSVVAERLKAANMLCD